MSTAGKTSISGYLSAASDTSVDGSKRGLLAIPRESLDQLTNVLWMNPSINIANPDQDWLDKQKAGADGLDESLRCSKNLLKKIADCVDNHCHPARAAHLCHSHRLLNPRIIRRIMLLVASELTKRTDRFRSWRNRIPFSDCMGAWVDRVDAATALWIGRDAFFAIFGYDQPITTVQTVEGGCEACILAIVGGRPQLLSDVRASMVARLHQYPNHGRTEPRLWRAVESWIEHFDDDVCEGILTACDVLAEQITKLNQAIEEEKDKRMKDPRYLSRYHPSFTKKSKTNKLPEPRRQKKRKTRSSSSMDMSKPAESLKPVVPKPETTYSDNRFEASQVESFSVVDSPPANAMPDAGEDDIDQTDNETWAWLERRMQSRGLTPKQSFAMLNDLHPAFSEYANRSAVPTPLNMGQAPTRASSMRSAGTRGSVKSTDRSSWATMYVNSDEEDDDNLTFEMESTRPGYMSQIPELEPCSGGLEQRETRDGDQSSYVPVRRSWKVADSSSSTSTVCPSTPKSQDTKVSGAENVQRNPAASPRRASSGSRIPRARPRRPSNSKPSISRPPLAYRPTRPPSPGSSSVYSSHPGFRRSADERSVAPPMPPIPAGGWI